MYERSYQAKVLKGDKSAHTQNAKDTPQNVTEKKVKKNYFAISWWRVFLIAIIGSILVGAFVVIRLPYFQITTVLVEGTVVLDQGDTYQFINKQLQGEYLKVFPKNSIFLFSTKKTEKNLKKQFSRIENVVVKKTNNHTITVTINEYKGVYVWCESEQSCFFMDIKGAVFAQAPLFSGNVYIKIFGGTKKDFPFYPISLRDLESVSKLVKHLEVSSIKPISFNFIDEHQLDIVFTHNGRDARIVVDPTLDPDASYRTFLTAFRTISFKKEYDSVDKYLEYIDLRFSKKIVYKFN